MSGDNQFIEKVSNCIDLEAGEIRDVYVKWGSIVSGRASGEAADDLASSSTSCSRVVCNEHCLSPYPVAWHTAHPLIHEECKDELSANPLAALIDRKWHMYSDCDCNGGTRYYLTGEPYAALTPAIIKARPPCCFTDAEIILLPGFRVLIRDSNRRCLALLLPELPFTLIPDPLVRDPEEAMMIVLAENIWWLAHESCRSIRVRIAVDQYKPAGSCYNTQLALPCVLVQKTCLADYCSKLQNVYPHVNFILS